MCPSQKSRGLCRLLGLSLALLPFLGLRSSDASCFFISFLIFLMTKRLRRRGSNLLKTFPHIFMAFRLLLPDYMRNSLFPCGFCFTRSSLRIGLAFWRRWIARLPKHLLGHSWTMGVLLALAIGVSCLEFQLIWYFHQINQINLIKMLFEHSERH